MTIEGFLTSRPPISELRQYFWSRFVLKHISQVYTLDSARFWVPWVPYEKSEGQTVHRPPPSVSFSNYHPHILVSSIFPSYDPDRREFGVWGSTTHLWRTSLGPAIGFFRTPQRRHRANRSVNSSFLAPKAKSARFSKFYEAVRKGGEKSRFLPPQALKLSIFRNFFGFYIGFSSGHSLGDLANHVLRQITTAFSYNERRVPKIPNGQSFLLVRVPASLVWVLVILGP